MRTFNFTTPDNSLGGALKQTVSLVVRSRIARFTIHFVFVTSLLFGLASPAFAEHCCDSEGEVRIAYKGIMCAFYPYMITLNGTEAHGPGDSCVMAAASTPKTFTTLKLNKPYLMTAGNVICITNINFQVPEGYTLYVDGQESNQIYKSDALHHVYSGDGAWEIVVRKKCDCKEQNPRGGATRKTGGLMWERMMGLLSAGRTAYGLSLAEKTLSAAIYTPSALNYAR